MNRNNNKIEEEKKKKTGASAIILRLYRVLRDGVNNAEEGTC